MTQEIDLGKIAITGGGEWERDKFVGPLVAVTRNGQSYLSLKASTGVDPEKDQGEYYMLIAERGESLYQMYVRTGRYSGTEEAFLNEYSRKLKAAEDAANAANNAAARANASAQKADEAVLYTQGKDREYAQAEAARKTAETGRNEAEAARVSADEAREQKTDQQLTAMAEKDAFYTTQEADRNAAEAARASEHASLKTASEKATGDANMAAAAANVAANHAETSATTIDAKINPVVENDKVQDGKIATLEQNVATIESRSDVVDVVATKAALDAYDITTITENDVIKVLKDESRKDEVTYYRLLSGKWEYIGSMGAMYTKGEVDAMMAARKDEVDTRISNDETKAAEQYRLNDIKNKEQDDRLTYIETKIGAITTKRWKSGEIVQEGQAVTMHGEFFVAKQATHNPPMWCMKSPDGKYLTDRFGNYLLAGGYNTTEYQQF